MADKEQMDMLIKKLSERMGTTEDEIRAAVAGSNYSKLLSRMDPARAEQLGKVLNDENAARELLNSPQAKALIKRLMG